MANDDFSALANMIYSGRGITVGMTPNGDPFVGYSLTGRSPSSQARKLVYDEQNQLIRTEVTDPEQLAKGSPALLLYPALAFVDNRIVASNGAQTKLIYNKVIDFSPEVYPDFLISQAFKAPFFEYDPKEGLIDLTTFEPDDPNFTPRISACLGGEGKMKKNIALHIVKRHPTGGKVTELHPPNLEPGKGYLITTYEGGNENPLQPFGKDRQKDPLEVKVGFNTPAEIVQSIYTAIHGGQEPDDNYRVAAAVMMLAKDGPEVAIMNRSSMGA